MYAARLTAACTIAVVAALAVGPVAGAAPDPGFPSGSFTIRQPTQYILDQDGDAPQLAVVDVKRLGLSDDATPAKDIVVTVHADAGAPGDQWLFGDDGHRLVYSGGTVDGPDPWVHIAGTYHPYVTLTDGDGHTTRVDLPVVTLREDHTAPVTRLALPRPRLRHTIVGWRVIRGTVVDAGIDRAGNSLGTRSHAGVVVMQRRHGHFYLYSFATKRWRKGLATEAATFRKFRPNDAPAIDVGRIGWRTPYIHGLTRGRLVVRVTGEDTNLNRQPGPPPVAARYWLTRRR